MLSCALSAIENDSEKAKDLSYFNQLPLPAWLVSQKDLKILAANPKAEQTYLYNQEEWNSLHFLNLFATACHKQLLDFLKQPSHNNHSFFLHMKEGKKLLGKLYLSERTFHNHKVWQIIAVNTASATMSVHKDLATSLERHNPYIQQSSECTWCYEFEHPLPINSSIAEMVSHFKKWAYLVESNHNNAQMLGATSVAEIMGLRLSRVMDFTRPEIVGLMKAFVHNNFRISNVELEARDLHNNDKYIVANFFGVVENDNLVRIWGTNLDITSKKEAEKKIRLLACLVEETFDVLAAVDLDWKHVSWNKGAENIYKITSKEILGKSIREFIPDFIYPNSSRDEVRNQINKNGFWRGEMSFIRPADKKQLTLLTHFKQLKDENGTLAGYVFSATDITEKKESEDQLRYQATMLENISDVIITAALDHLILQWNNAAEEVFGASPEEITGKPFYELISFGSAITYQQILAELATFGTWKGEVSITNKKDGSKKHLIFNLSYLTSKEGKKIAIMGLGRDITDRKKASEKLLESEQFYRNLIADSANGVLLTEVDGTLKFASNAVQTILGYNPEEVLGINCFSFIHPDEQALAMESFQRELEANPIDKSIEIRLRKHNGEWLWCLVRGHNLLNNPYVQGIVIYFHDNSANKKASDALRESEHRFRTLIRDIQVGVVLLDDNSNVILSNRAIHEMFLVSDKEIMGNSIYSFTGDVIDEKGDRFHYTECPVYKAVHQKTQINDVVMGVFRPKSNDRVWVMMNADPIFGQDGKLVQVICSIKDISERKKLENKLVAEQISHQKQLTKATIDGQERERREIGKELHDNFGQQLTTIKLFLDMAKSTADDTTNEMISLALKGVSDVINGMRQMSRNIMPPTLGDLGLIDSVFDLIESINRTQAINIEFDFFEFSEIYLAENKQLMVFRIIQEQLNNIIKHAQADNVTIRLYNNEFETFLEINDDGKGFDINTVKKGLGLANIRNRAEIFSGNVTITSSPGNGCQVVVYVPNKQEQTQ